MSDMSGLLAFGSHPGCNGLVVVKCSHLLGINNGNLSRAVLDTAQTTRPWACNPRKLT